MASSNGGGGGGLGLASVIGIVFIILKLVGVIDWRWIWVLSPFWIGIAAFIIVAVVLFGIHLLLKK